ncbi:ester cyclase [Spirosoma areae]
MMDVARQNKAFILDYYNAVSGVAKTPALLAQYITDQALIDHITFFDGAFPNYELYADELTAEGNRVVVRARFKGMHQGEWNGIPPSYRPVTFTFIIGYEIRNQKIVSQWLVADQLTLLDQLGIEAVTTSAQ